MKLLEYIYQEVKQKRLSVDTAAQLIEQFQPVEAQNSVRTPLLTVVNTSDMNEWRYSVTIEADAFFVRDHVVNGTAIVPAAAQLDIAFKVASAFMGVDIEAELELFDLMWIRPIVLDGPSLPLHMAIVPSSHHQLEFELYSAENEAHIFFQGKARRTAVNRPSALDVEALVKQPKHQQLHSEQIYQRLAAMGIHYGASHQGIEALSLLGEDKKKVLANISVPVCIKRSKTDFVVHPALFDSALQASTGLALTDNASEETHVPFALASFRLFDKSVDHGNVLVEFSDDNQNGNAEGKRPEDTSAVRQNTVSKVNLQLCTNAGEVFAQFQGFSSRVIATNATALQATGSTAHPEKVAISSEKVATMLYAKSWQTAAAKPQRQVPSRRIVLLVGDLSQTEEITSNFADCEVVHLPLAVDVPTAHLSQRFTQQFVEISEQVFTHLQRFIQQTQTDTVLVQLALSHVASECGALSSLMKTAAKEHSRFSTQTICLPANASVTEIAAICAAETSALDEEINYLSTAQRQVVSFEPMTVDAEFAAQNPWCDQGVYVISGGAGALGLMLARHCIQRCDYPSIVLLGRSALSDTLLATLDELKLEGAEVSYYQVDITDASAVQTTLTDIHEKHKKINGIIHCAGVIRDSLIAKKSLQDFRQVLAVKCHGLVNIDLASRDMPLDFFVTYSSIAAVVGNPGQSDYALANGYMDAYLRQRAKQQQLGERHGLSLSVNWPLWEAGNMSVDAAMLAQLNALGIELLAENEGCKVLDSLLSQPSTSAQAVVLHGKGDKLLQRLMPTPSANSVPPVLPEAPITTNESQKAADTSLSSEFKRKVLRFFKNKLSSVVKMPPERIDTDTPMERFGIDSIMVMELNQVLEADFGELPRTLFFEVQTLRGLSDYFTQNYREKLNTLLGETATKSTVATPRKQPVAVGAAPTGSIRKRRQPALANAVTARAENTPQDIAIIGIHGRYPQSNGLKEYWENLVAGKDCIEEIPANRWDYRPYFHPDKHHQGTSYSKWGGFIAGVDEFDPLFFSIAPREAQMMDPQERLFLQSVHATLEDAGYTPASLINRETNVANVGVFVGVMYEEYQLYGAQAQALGQPFALGGSAATIANRVSYIFNFQGPSLALDTMCSSSLTSVHLACDALRQNRCDVAVAGGVNVTIHPNKYLMLSQGKFTSSKGKCESFGEGGDGYVPGEGVGSVLLKPIAQAQEDNDHIYAVIKGSAVNHGGKTNGYTVPNPIAQGAVIEKALQEAGVNPEDLDYIEAHGTGTSLGDPIEISGLSKAFTAAATAEIPAQSCIIGSVKSNIGHLESAAGIAGISKVVLQMQHQQIVPSIHSSTLNPNINFAKTPFKVQQTLIPWPKNEQKLRLAGVSSFGAGGSNAHIILQEYPQAQLPDLSVSPTVIVLSAKSEAQLFTIAKQLNETLSTLHNTALTHLAYTLQVGREEMPYRFAAIVNDVAELQTALQAFAKGQLADETFQGYVAPDSETKVLFSEDEELQEAVGKWLAKGKFPKLMELWVKGLHVDWQLLYANLPVKPQRMSLPTYPFANERYWIDMTWQTNTPSSATQVFGMSAAIHPLVQRNESDAFSTRFASTFTPKHWFLADHQINGEKLLPGVCYLEMARQAVAMTLRTDAALSLQNVHWLRPLSVGDTNVDVEIDIQVQDEVHAQFSVWKLAPEAENSESPLANSHIKLCEGTAVILSGEQTLPEGSKMLADWEAVCTHSNSDTDSFYQRLKTLGLNYGPAHRAVQRIATGVDARGKPRVLAEIDLPESLLADAEHFDLHPGLLDSALQACFGLAMVDENTGASSASIRVPFAVESVEIYGTCREFSRVMICQSEHDLSDAHATASANAASSVEKLDISLVNRQGEIQVKLSGFSSRVLSATPTHQTALFAPQWQAANTALIADAASSASTNTPHHIIWLQSEAADASIAETELCAAFPDISVTQLPLPVVTNVDANAYQQVAEQLMAELAKVLANTNASNQKTSTQIVQLVIRSSQPEWSGLAGMMKTAAQEQPTCKTQTVLLPTSINLSTISTRILQDAVELNAQEVRYLDSEGQQRQVRQLEQLTTLSLSAESRSAWRERGVYLITGGAGGLGMIVAKDIATRSDAPTLYLVGRSPLNPQQQANIAQLTEEGANVVYRQVDIGDKTAVEALIATIQRDHNQLHGVLHSAGVTRDNFITRKTRDELEAVLTAKVSGIVNLDQATQHIALDVFVGFSSLAALYGNVGQADYAVANGFMDAYLVKRAERVVTQGIGGLSLSINWPLWEDGGMQLDEVFTRVLAGSGIVPLPTAMGLKALEYTMLLGEQSQVAVLSGDIDLQLSALANTKDSHTATQKQQVTTSSGRSQLSVKPSSDTVSANITDDTDAVYELAVAYFKSLLSGVLKLAPERIDESLPLEHYGIDSVMVMELTLTLEDTFGALPKTLFYEVQSLEALTRYFIDNHSALLQTKVGAEVSNDASGESEVNSEATHPAAVNSGAIQAQRISHRNSQYHSQQYAQRRPTTPILRSAASLPAAANSNDNTEANKNTNAVGDIAIIGVAGRYPQAKDIDQFWENLTAGKDCITEVPASRWDIGDYYDPDKTRKDTMYLKWGGFIESFDQFDPKFFNISPREARIMDPQERVFMECVHHVLEDAGYTRANIGRSDKGFGAEVGVFVGAMYEEYQLYGAAEQAKGNPLVVPGNLASIANRVSYVFDFHGPSLTVDTMCSSSLTSLHLACQNLREGQCKVAVAGGVNLTLHPNKYLMLSQGQFVSSKGRCESFGEGGDGYVPGEGVGAVLLKPLKDAEKDSDQIYAVIKSSHLNHGGKTNGYTVPNPIAQGKVIAQALTCANIDPHSISYIEAHGTGTLLGDPIEISGLSKGFAEAVKAYSGEALSKDFRCAIGSVKSNIGHLESAAGIAGITKILMQFKHNQLVPSIHSTVLNQNIDFDNLPFCVQQHNQPWWRQSDTATDASTSISTSKPRRAGISSFGAGGSNAHVILEDYIKSDAKNDTKSDALNAEPKSRPGLHSLARLFVLSAASEAQLIHYAGMMVEHLAKAFKTDVNLAQVASLLQTGRESQRFRLAFIGRDASQVIAQLQAVAAAQPLAAECWLFDSKNAEPAQVAAHSAGQRQKQLREWLKVGQVHSVAEAWTRGCNFDWDALYIDAKPQKISLSRYPFAHKRYWLPLTTQSPKPHYAQQSNAVTSSAMPATLPTTQQQAAVASATLTADLKEISKEHQLMSQKQSATKVSLTPLDSRASLSMNQPDSAPHTPSALAYLVTSFARLVGKDVGEIDENAPLTHQGLPGQYSDLAQTWVEQIVVALNVSVNPVRLYDYPTLAKLAKHIESLPALAAEQPQSPKREGQWVKLAPLTSQAVPTPMASHSETQQSRSPSPLHQRSPAQELPISSEQAPLLNAAMPSVDEVESYLVHTLADALFTDINDVERSTPFVELGLDSIIGVEWMRVINETYQLNINATLLYDNPNIESFAAKVHGLIEEAAHSGQAGLASQPSMPSAVAVERSANTTASLSTNTPAALSISTTATPSTNSVNAQPEPAMSLNALEDDLAHSLAEALLLEIDDIERDKPFVELGLDSIIGVEWVRAINETHHTNLNAVMLYENPTIEALAIAVADVIASNTSDAPNELVPTQPAPQALTAAEPATTIIEQATAVFAPSNNQGSVADHSVVEQQLAESFADALLMDLEDVDLEQPFVEMGLDSIVGVEWVRGINNQYGIELNATKLYDYPNIKLLADYVIDEVNAQLVGETIQTPINAAQQAPAHMESAIWGLQREPQPTTLAASHTHTVQHVADASVANSARNSQRTEPMQQASTPLSKTSLSPAIHSHNHEDSVITPNAAPALSTSEQQQIPAGHSAQVRDTRVAVIGMSGRYPNSPTLADYWQNLQAGNNCVDQIPAERWALEENSCHWLGSLSDIEYFDAPFFAITEDVATVLDPQQRIFLQEAYKAFEDAGYSPQRLNGKKCGVYFGIMQNDYDFILQEYSPAESANGANSLSIAASRLSYFLNLKGPAIPIDTACSSSLVGVHLACQSIASGETDMALVGGATLYLSPRTYAGMSRENMLSTDGRCKAFDNSADGFVPGEGVGAVVLKRFTDAEKDGDPIHGVIIGSGTNQDGKTNGHAAPSMSSQRELIESVYRSHNIPPQTVSYIEMHGTGTKLGDSIEVQALSQAFAKHGVPKNSCAIGSVKSNIGHTAAAAGVASIHKVLLAMQHQFLPATLHVQQDNEYCDLGNSPLFVNRHPTHWTSADGSPLRAGVSAFGISGTNAHIVLESYRRPSRVQSTQNASYVLVLSAKTSAQLAQMASKLAAYIHNVLADGKPLDEAGLAFTLQEGRAVFSERLAFVFTSISEVRDKLLSFQQGQQDASIYSTASKGQSQAALPALSPMLPSAGLAAVARGWVQGQKVAWQKLYRVAPSKVHVPGYAFEQLTFWVDTTPQAQTSAAQPVASEMAHVSAEVSAQAAIHTATQAANQVLTHALSQVATPSMAQSASGASLMAAPQPEQFASVTRNPQEQFDWQNELTRLCAELLVPPSEGSTPSLDAIDAELPWNVLGFDSMKLGLLCNRLNAMVDTYIRPTVFFEFVNIQGLSEYLTSIAPLPNQTTLEKPTRSFQQQQSVPPVLPQVQEHAAANVESIAIVGLSALFPQAESLADLWQQLATGASSITTLDSEFWSNPEVSSHDLRNSDLHSNGLHSGDAAINKEFAATINTDTEFDCSALQIAPAQFAQLSRKRKLLIKQSLLAVEDAGYSLQALREQHVAVFVGSNGLDVDRRSMATNELIFPTDANLLSRVFDVNGPSEMIDCGSATAITAIDKASQALMNGECDIALVACANIFESQQYHAALQASGLLSSDGKTQLFAPQGKGYVRSEGVAVFLLKKRSVAEAEQGNIYATIAACGSGHSVRSAAQGRVDAAAMVNVIAKSYQQSGIRPDSLAYVELDARAIEATDEQEIQGLKLAYQHCQPVGAKSEKLCVSSVKPLLGHAEHASGALSLITVLLQMKHQTLLGRQTETHSAETAASHGVEWRSSDQNWAVPANATPRRAAVNSFDITGACAHLVLQDYVDERDNGLPEQSSKNLAIILLSASSLAKLQSQAQTLAQFMQGCASLPLAQRQNSLTDIAYTSQVGRDAQRYRLAVTVFTLEEAIRCLSSDSLFGNNAVQLTEQVMSGDAQGNQAQHELFQDVEIISEFLEKWIAAGDYRKLVKLWVSGIDIQWQNLYGLAENTLRKGKRISMPGRDLSRLEAESPTLALTDTESALAQVWEQVLHISVTNKHESFYTLGGHFLLLPELKKAFKHQFNQTLPEAMWQQAFTLEQLAHKLDQLPSNKSDLLSALQPTTQQQELPLSFAQNAYWFFYSMDGQRATYNLPCVIELKGAFNHKAFEASLRKLTLRQEGLRTQLYQYQPNQLECGQSHSGPRQRVVEFPANQPVFSLNEIAAIDLQNALANEVIQPLDLSEGFPLRTVVWRLSNVQHVVSFVFHHATMDGWSIGIFLKELADLYACENTGRESKLPELPIQYRDFAVWQNTYLSGVVHSKQLQYWQQKLGGLAPMLNLPTDYARPAVQSYRGAKTRFKLPELLHAQLKDFCRNHSFTLYNTLLSGLALLLSRYCRTCDVPIGTAAGNRSHMALENVIGCFANTLPLRCSVDEQQGFIDLVAHTSKTSFEAFQHADVPFDAIVGAVAPKRSLGVPPIFQVMFRLHNQDMGMALDWHELEFQFHDYESQVAELDLNISLIETAEGLVGEVAYATDLFAADTIERLIQHYEQVLTSVMAQSHIPLSDISLLSEKEREQVFAWNQTTVDYPKQQCIHALFEQSAQQYPDKIAYVCGDEAYTYAQLNEKANRLAHWLIGQGAGPEVAVGVSVSRSSWMGVCALAAFKAGAIYVPLDPNYPADRLEHMLDVAKPALILSEANVMQQAFQQVSIPVIALDGDEIDWHTQSHQKTRVTENPPAQVNAEHSAYILFTSGSTGKPKGILVAHKSFRNMVEAHRAWGLISEENVILQFASLSFSISLWGSFMAWAGGGKLVQVTDAESLPDEALYKLIEKQKVTIATWPVSLLTVLPVEKIYQSLRTIISSAEPCNDAVVERWVNSGRRFMNMYGNSEVSLGSTMYEYKTLGQKLTIGKPFPNTQMYILDDNLQPVPPGVVAEIYTGGVGLAKAYYGNPVATAKKFIADPFHPEDPEARLYSTGDLGRYLPNGEIEFIGREDFQVSIRGFRVELTEIEGVLRAQERIADVAVVTTPDKDGVDCLTCFYVTNDSADIGAQALRGVVACKLPNYMVPNLFVRLDAMPLTPNRKVDRLALPGLLKTAVTSGETVSEKAVLQDDVERELAEIWCRILRVQHIPAQADFFNVGGHSLLALQLIEDINQHFSVSLPVTTLFSASTIQEQAQAVKAEQKADNHSPLVLMQSCADATQKAYLVPGAGGSLFNLYELAKHLGDEFQVYGLQALGLREGESILASVEEIARENISAILAEDSEASITLIGHSFGGWIVFEMAKQLQQHSRNVSVVLLDSPTPNAANDRVKQQKLNTDSDEQLTQFIDDLFASSESSTQQLSQAQQAMKQRVKEVALAQVSIRYRPKAMLKGLACLNIVAQPTEGLSDDLDFHWPRLLEKRTQVSEVKADHFGMLSGDIAADIAQKVKKLSVASES